MTKEPALSVSVVGRREIVLGAFQRRANALTGAAGIVTRRVSGGPAIVVGPGSVHVVLALPTSNSVVADADPPRVVNRHVRPLLRALTRFGAPAAYFGRDVVSVAKRPVAWVGFAHHAATGATIFEAFVAVSHAFALPPELDGAPARRELSYGGKAATTLGRDAALVAEAIAGAYRAAYPGLAEASLSEETLRPLDSDARSAFSAIAEAPIGFVGAIVETGDSAVGGDLFASEDLIDALADALATGDRTAVEATLREHAGVLDGVRSETILDLARGALEAHR